MVLHSDVVQQLNKTKNLGIHYYNLLWLQSVCCELESTLTSLESSAGVHVGMTMTQGVTERAKLKKNVYTIYKCLQVWLQFSPLKLGKDVLATSVVALYKEILTLISSFSNCLP